MLLFPELPTAFPWYDKKEKQIHNKANSYGATGADLISPSDTLLPFIFRKPAASEIPTGFEIRLLCDDTLVASLDLGAIHFANRAGYDYYWAYGDGQMDLADGNALTLDPGQYYAVMSFVSGQYFSEAFTVPQMAFSVYDSGSIEFVKITWWNDCDLPPIFYKMNPVFKNVMYLDTTLTASEPEIEQEAEKDGDNEDVPTFQKAIVRYRISTIVPDFMKLALSLLPIHDHVEITLEKGIRSGEVKNLTVESQLEETGFLSTVEIRFEQELVIVKRNCCEDLIADPCPEMPSDAALAMTVLTPTRNVRIFASIPAGIYAEVWGSYYSAGPYFLVSNYQPAAAFVNGATMQNPMNYLWFRLVLKTFSCTVGTSGSKKTSSAIVYRAESTAFISAAGLGQDYQGAILDRLVRDLFGETNPNYSTNNIWANILAAYPMIGGTAAAHKFNLVNPVDADSAFRLLFPNGATHSAAGIAANGTNQYADTRLSPAGYILGQSMHMGFVMNQYNGSSGINMGVTGPSGSAAIINVQPNVENVFLFDPGFPYQSADSVNKPNTYFAVRDGVNLKYFKGTAAGFMTTPTTATAPSGNVFLMANNNVGSPASYTNARYSFFTIGTALLDGQVNGYRLAIAAFNTALGR